MQFKDIKNQQVLINHLTEIIDSGRVSHAQLFLGPTSSGSLALAIAYAQYLNCQHRQHYAEGHPSGLRADSCGECPNCKKYQQLVHPDLHLTFPNITPNGGTEKASAEIYIEDFRKFLSEGNQLSTLDDWYNYLNTTKQGMIRELDAAHIVRDISLKAYEGGYKVFIIWMAEKMNLAASNELLKSLEEPTDNTLILLVAEDTDRILPTIISRTQTIRIKELPMQSADNSEFAQLFVQWMRLLFKLNMAPLSEWCDKAGSMPKEQQKQFLRYSMEALRACFLKTAGGAVMDGMLAFGDEKFNASFPAMITTNNVAGISLAVSAALSGIERNANSKLAFMDLSFKMSRLIKKR